jgi:hypothetical protein
MSDDIREDILLRLLAIGEGMRPAVFKSFDRNKLDLDPKQFPQGVLLDSDEDIDDRQPTRTGRAGFAALQFVTMSPQIFLCAQGLAEEAGSKLNFMRKSWLRAVLVDSALLGLVGENGYIRYEGAVSSFRLGRQLDSTMLVTVAFGYIFNPKG